MTGRNFPVVRWSGALPAEWRENDRFERMLRFDRLERVY